MQHSYITFSYMNTMTIQDYRKLWKQALHLCEIEKNIDEAASFTRNYFNNNKMFERLDEKQLFLVFIGLVVYEEKIDTFYGSTSPAAWCYQELLKRVDADKYDRELIYDVGDWAAKYSSNPYVPMGTRHNFGPRKYFEYEKERHKELEKRIAAEQIARKAKEERVKRRIEEGKKKVEEAKKKHQERLKILQDLRNRTIPEALSYICEGKKPIFYYIELVEDWFKNGELTDEQKGEILAMFPDKSTKHNNRIKKRLLGNANNIKTPNQRPNCFL